MTTAPTPADLLAYFHGACPTIRPTIYPRSLRRAMEDTEERHLGKVTQYPTACTLCGTKPSKKASSSSSSTLSSSSELCPRGEWTLDFASATLTFERLMFLCPLCELMSDLPRFIEQSVGTSSNGGGDDGNDGGGSTGEGGGAAADAAREKAVRRGVVHFVGLNKAGTKTETDAFAWVQEIYSIAYSLLVIASNMTLQLE